VTLGGVDHLLAREASVVRCGDCGRDRELPVDDDATVLLAALRGFLVEHERCALAVTLDLRFTSI
jgi:hypothetical protein